jgi:hypothetical protein
LQAFSRVCIQKPQFLKKLWSISSIGLNTKQTPI